MLPKRTFVLQFYNSKENLTLCYFCNTQLHCDVTSLTRIIVFEVGWHIVHEGTRLCGQNAKIFSVDVAIVLQHRRRDLHSWRSDLLDDSRCGLKLRKFHCRVNLVPRLRLCGVLGRDCQR